MSSSDKLFKLLSRLGKDVVLSHNGEIVYGYLKTAPAVKYFLKNGKLVRL